MTDCPLTFGLIGGSMRDFNRTWFKILGNTVVGTMLLNVILPIIESCSEKFWKTYHRCRDRGCCSSDKYKTKFTSIAAYIDLYSGI